MAKVATIDIPVYAEYNGERVDIGTITLDVDGHQDENAGE